MAEKYISLWADQTDANRPWIVSLDTEDTTSTIKVIGPDDGNYQDARQFAVAEAKRRGMRCVETDRYGNSQTIFDPAPVESLNVKHVEGCSCGAPDCPETEKTHSFGGRP